MRWLCLVAIAAVALALGAGCSETGEPPAAEGPAGETPAGEETEQSSPGVSDETKTVGQPSGPLVVGWLFPSARDEAALQLVKDALGEQVLVLAAENAQPEHEVGTRAQALVDQDATFLVGAGLEYCRANPNVHCVEFAASGDAPANVALYVPAAWAQEYLLGLAAGLVTETDTTAYLATSRTPESKAAVNAWALGCQTTNPNCITRMIVLKDGEAPAGVAEPLGADVDVVRSAVDDPRLCKVGEGRKPWLSGGAGTTCPDRVIAEPFVDIGAIVLRELGQELEGTWSGGRTEVVGFGDGAGLGPWGSAVPADVQAEVEAAATQIEAGENVFVGPLYDNQGEERIPEGEQLTEDFLASQWDWLLGGVLRAG